MKKNLKKSGTILVIFLIITSLVIIYKIIQNNTADRIFSEAVIDIPENTSNADEAIQLIEKNLITNMPYCRITRLYEDDTAFKPLIQRYNDNGKETLLLKILNSPALNLKFPGTNHLHRYNALFQNDAKILHIVTKSCIQYVL